MTDLLTENARLRSMQIVYQRMETIAASGVKIAINTILLGIIKDIHNVPLPQMPETVRGAPDNGAGGNIGS